MNSRLAVGADPDITIFDPERVIDRTTFDKPGQYSEGIPYVLVKGVSVVNAGELHESVLPGRGLRR